MFELILSQMTKSKSNSCNIFGILGLPSETHNAFSKFLRKRRQIFSEKTKGLGCVPQNELLVTDDLAGLYPSIPHLEG